MLNLDKNTTHHSDMEESDTNNSLQHSENNIEYNSNINLDDNKFILRRNIMRKVSRTLVVKSINNIELSESLFNELDGILKIVKTKLDNLIFLIFDTTENSLIALKLLKNNLNLKIKFSYYKVFFTITGLDDSTDYNEVKKDLIDLISNSINANVLYCKFYYKNNKYLGCGDLTVDTLDSMIQLVAKDSPMKNFSFNLYTGTFYKFNEKK
jgi:hypothetical protein